MTQVQRLQRLNLVLGGLAVLLIAVLVFRPAETSVVQEEKLPSLVPEFRVEDARSIRVQRLQKPDAPATSSEPDEIRVVHVDGVGWTLPSAYGLPADADRVTGFLEAVIGAKRKALLTRREETFGEYAKANDWIRVQVDGQGGATLASFYLGDPSTWPNSYVRIRDGDEDVIVEASNLTRDKVGLALRSWSETRLWPDLSLPAVARAVVRRSEKGKGTLSFVRASPQDDPAADPMADPAGVEDAVVWRMRAPKEADADTMKVDNLVRSFTGMRFDNVVSADRGAEAATKFGLDKPIYKVFVYGRAPIGGGDAPKYVLEVGGEVPAKSEGGVSQARYVRRDGSPWILTVLSYSLDEFGMVADAFLPEPPAPPEDGGDEEAPPPEDRATGNPDEGESEDDSMPPLPPLPPVRPEDAPEDEPNGEPKEPGQPQEPDEPKEPDEPR